MCINCDDEGVSRRSFLAVVTAAGAALTSRVKGQQPNAPGSKALDDPSITHGALTFNNGRDAVKGYLARPKKAGRYRRVVVVSHGNPGIPEDIPYWNLMPSNSASELIM